MSIGKIKKLSYPVKYLFKVWQNGTLACIHVIRPENHAFQQIVRCLRISIQNTIDQSHGFVTNNISVGFKCAVRVTVNPAVFSCFADFHSSPVIGNIAEVRCTVCCALIESGCNRSRPVGVIPIISCSKPVYVFVALSPSADIPSIEKQSSSLQTFFSASQRKPAHPAHIFLQFPGFFLLL